MKASQSRPEPPAARRREDERQGTPRQLLEAAGHVFAEKGFDRTTGKEIAESAGVHAAAINYHFGGMDGLYAAVLEEAHNRFVTLEMLSAAVANQPDARSKLEALIRLVVGVLMGPISSSWALRVLGREAAAPSPAIETLRVREFLPKAGILKGIVAELISLPPDHPTVARACISVLAPFLMLLLTDRKTLKRVFPTFGLGAADAEAVADQMIRFSLAGIDAVARDAAVPDN